MTRYHILLVLLFFLGGCGTSKDGSNSGQVATNADATVVGASKSVVVLADYATKPVDILVIRENSGALRAPEFPFGIRINQPSNGGVMAIQTLALGLLETLGARARVAFLDTTFANEDGYRSGAGRLLRVPPKVPGAAPGDAIITAKTNLQFLDDVVATSRWTQDQYNPLFFRPLDVIMRLAAASTDATTTSAGFLRREAFLSILYVTYSDEIYESTESGDVAEALNAAVGAGNWSVSGIVPDRTGCAWKKTDKSDRNTNDGGDIAKMDPNYKRKNKIHKLIESSGGIFGSLCQDTYFETVGRFVKEATRAGYFPVPISDVIDPKSISVTVAGYPAEGWRYLVSEKTLLLPTTIKVGTVVTVTYTVTGITTGAVITPTAGVDGEIPVIKPSQLSKSELAFATSIRSILQREGCIGCHPKYSAYEAAWNERATILMAIQRMKGDLKRMPRNATNDADFSSVGNFTDLKTWLSE